MSKSVYSQEYARFREMLTESRKAIRLTQAGLAMRLGRPQSFVSKYESGERRLDLLEFLEVAKALGIDAVTFVQDLQSRIEEQPDAD